MTKGHGGLCHQTDLEPIVTRDHLWDSWEGHFTSQSHLNNYNEDTTLDLGYPGAPGEMRTAPPRTVVVHTQRMFKSFKDSLLGPPVMDFLPVPGYHSTSRWHWIVVAPGFPPVLDAVCLNCKGLSC